MSIFSINLIKIFFQETQSLLFILGDPISEVLYPFIDLIRSLLAF